MTLLIAPLLAPLGLRPLFPSREHPKQALGHSSRSYSGGSGGAFGSATGSTSARPNSSATAPSTASSMSSGSTPIHLRMSGKHQPQIRRRETWTYALSGHARTGRVEEQPSPHRAERPQRDQTQLPCQAVCRYREQTGTPCPTPQFEPAATEQAQREPAGGPPQPQAAGPPNGSSRTAQQALQKPSPSAAARNRQPSSCPLRPLPKPRTDKQDRTAREPGQRPPTVHIATLTQFPADPCIDTCH